MKKSVYHLHLSVKGIYNNGGIAKGFQKAGYDVLSLNWQHERAKVGLRKLRQNILEDIEALSPTLVFAQVQSAGVLDDETVTAIMNMAPMVIWTVDARSEQDSEWMYDLNKKITHFFYSNINDVYNCMDRGIINCSKIQSSCDPDEYTITGQVDHKVPPIVFIGNKTTRFPLSQQRTEMVLELKREFGDQFKAYGLGFDEGFVVPRREVEIYNSAKIAITQNHFDYAFYQSDRLWRALACGCFPVEYGPGLTKRIKEALQYVDIDARLIRHANRSLLLNSNTYYHRVLEIEKELSL